LYHLHLLLKVERCPCDSTNYISVSSFPFRNSLTPLQAITTYFVAQVLTIFIGKMVFLSQPRVIVIFFVPAKMGDVSEGLWDILSEMSDVSKDKAYTQSFPETRNSSCLTTSSRDRFETL
jgi:hypothetical protein